MVDRRLGRGREGRRVFRGWLLFFFASVCSGVLRGIRGIARDAGAVESNAFPAGEFTLGVLALLALALQSGLLVASLYGLYLLAMGDARTPTWWGRVLVASAATSVSLVAVQAYRSTVLDETPLALAFWSAARLSGWSGLAVTLGWLAYWMRSERVRDTFGANAFQERT